jgi:hypothetical protein
MTTPTDTYSQGPSLGDIIREIQRRERERLERIPEKLRRLAHLVDFDKDQVWLLQGFERLKGGPLLGNGSCAVLPQIFGGVPQTKYWKEGPRVLIHDKIIPYGTVIATFVGGVYPNWKHGNHAAIYGGAGLWKHDGRMRMGIHIFDQWKDKKSGPNWRHVVYGDGVSDRSNDGAAFSVVLTQKPFYPIGGRIPVRH